MNHTHRNRAEHYRYDATAEPTFDEPATRYNADQYPTVAQSLAYINQLALYHEETALFQRPQDDPEAYRLVQDRLHSLKQLNEQNYPAGLRIVSFDIDLTIATGEDYEARGQLIDPAEISRLQDMGYIVGTCSDRLPSDQWETIQRLGQQPDFCIPKEMLGHLGAVIPASERYHIGDDQRRDRDVAEQAGWTHIWTHDY